MHALRNTVLRTQNTVFRVAGALFWTQNMVLRARNMVFWVARTLF